MFDLAKYSFANAKIRAMLSSLVEPALFSRLIESSDLYEALDILKNTPYKSIVEKIDRQAPRLEPLEQELLKYDLTMYRKVYNALSTKYERYFVSLLMQRYELEELKVALRIWHGKIEVDLDDYLLNENIYYHIDFKKIVSVQTIEEIILLLDETAYKQPLLKAKDTFKNHNATFYLEVALDKDYYARLIEAAKSFSAVDRGIAEKVLGIEIDAENINWLIRMRKYYAIGMGDILNLVIPGGAHIDKDAVRKFYTTDGLSKVVESVAFGAYIKVKDLAEENIYFIDQFLYEILLKEIKKTLAGFPFTIGTVLGYLILKRKETRNIISLLYSKMCGMDKEDTGRLLYM
ncbi:MAG: V-type ATPase subunit [Candidatus Omnitrophota bacterium]